MSDMKLSRFVGLESMKYFTEKFICDSIKGAVHFSYFNLKDSGPQFNYFFEKYLIKKII